jgi:CheY-like chemotaxis protein
MANIAGMSNHMSLVRDNNGRPLYRDGNIRDITERKQAEEELLAAKMQAELYLDLMGHDISNMHQIIVGRLELAQEIIDQEGRLERDDKEMIDISVRTLQRSARLIENVRNPQKLSGDNIKLERMDLGEVFDEAVKGYTGIPGRDIMVNAEIKPGVVIIDFRLLDMDGLDVMKEILAIQPGTKVIFISGDDGIQKDALDAGASVFMKNPTDIKVITATVNSLLNS